MMMKQVKSHSANRWRRRKCYRFIYIPEQVRADLSCVGLGRNPPLCLKHHQVLDDGVRGRVEVLRLRRERRCSVSGVSDANYRCRPSALCMRWDVERVTYFSRQQTCKKKQKPNCRCLWTHVCISWWTGWNINSVWLLLFQIIRVV